MIRRDVIVVAQCFDPDHPRKRFRGPSGHRVHPVQLDEDRGI